MLIHCHLRDGEGTQNHQTNKQTKKNKKHPTYNPLITARGILYPGIYSPSHSISKISHRHFSAISRE